MGTLAFEFAVMVFVTILAAVLFVLWIGFLTGRALLRAMGLVRRGDDSVQMPTRRCKRLRCGASNPAQAIYCRRCGTKLPSIRVEDPYEVFRQVA